MRSAAAVMLIVVAGVMHLAAQRPIPPRDRGQAVRTENEAPRGTAVLRGYVVAADNGSPIRRAQVRVSGGRSGSTRLATTDPQGRFEVRDLPAGRYVLGASKGGFVSLQYGQKRPSESGTPLELADGQVMEKLVIALPRGSVIGGRILDEFGEPIANAVVTAMRYGFASGARRLRPSGGQNARDTTDDQGHFRLFGLPPGDYVVSAAFRQGGDATDPNGENTGYAPTYYPGTSSIAEAQRVTVAVGQEQSNIIFSLIATRLVRVSGAVLNSQGTAVTEGTVMLGPIGSARVAGPTPMSNFAGRINSNGQFRLVNVPPGRYLAQVRTGRLRGNNVAAGEFGRQEITVGAQDLDGVLLVTAPAARVSGYIVGDNGAALTISPQQVSVGARPVALDSASPSGNSTTRPRSDWTFEINDLYDPRVFRVTAPDGWALKSVTLNGQDITDTPLDVTPGQTISGLQITLTERLTEISGRLADVRNTPITDATIVIFPADEGRWMYQSRFIRAVRPDQDGRFQIRGLPPYDDYLALAVQGLEEGQAGDPEFLSSVRNSAVRLSLKDGESRVLDLRPGSQD
jgi:hypothetical protein